MNQSHKYWQLCLFTAIIGSVLPGFASADNDLETTANKHSTFLKIDPISNQLGFFDLEKRESQFNSNNFFLQCKIATKGSNQLEDIALIYLNDLKSNLGFNDMAGDFIFNELKESQFGSQHLSFVQKINGIEVYGTEIKVHIDKELNIRAINGVSNTGAAGTKTANIPFANAIEIAKNEIKKLTKIYQLNNVQKAMLQYEGPNADLYYLGTENGIELCWKVTYCPNFHETWQVFVSAESGKILDKKELSCHLDGPKTSNRGTTLNNKDEVIGTYRIGDNFYLIDASKSMFNADDPGVFPDNPKGVIKTFDADLLIKEELDKAFIPSSKTNAFGKNRSEKAVVSAQVNASIFYDKLESAPFNYKSYDNKGSSIIMYTNLNNPTNPFIGWNNASWNGRVALFGKGYNLYKSPLSKGLDVVSHELTHGLVQHGTRIGAATTYQNASLIEAICDIMGIVVDGNFTLGENSDVDKAYRASGLIRNLESPHSGLSNSGNWQANQSNGYTANHMRELVADKNAAQYNSTIISYAFYLMTGKAPGDGIGLKVASELFFDVVTNYLGSGANFYDFKDAMLLAVNIRFGAGSGYYNVIRKAFTTVGLETNDQVINQDDLPALIGDNFIISNISTKDKSNELSLFKMSEATEDIRFSQLDDVKNNASVTDNGTYIYAANANNEIIKIKYGEQLLVSKMTNSIGKGYSEVAVSKQNERLALVKYEEDTSIHVYDFSSRMFRKFPIKIRPTTVVHGNEFYKITPKRAGSMEWNYAGNKIIFEFENSFIDKNGETHLLWNVGEIEVWDTTAQDFANGNIHTFYDQLSSDLDLRYPSFAKNSTSIFIHDVYDRRKQQNTIVAWNRLDMETIKTDIIKTQIPSHASYTDTDLGLVITDLDEKGEPALFLIQLNLDKVSVKKGLEPIKLLSERKNPRWFTLGIRTSLAPQPEINNLKVYPNPCTDFIWIKHESTNEPSSFEIFNTLGQKVQSGSLLGEERINVSNLQKGQYFLRFKNGLTYSSIHFVKE